MEGIPRGTAPDSGTEAPLFAMSPEADLIERDGELDTLAAALAREVLLDAITSCPRDRSSAASAGDVEQQFQRLSAACPATQAARAALTLAVAGLVRIHLGAG